MFSTLHCQFRVNTTRCQVIILISNMLSGRPVEMFGKLKMKQNGLTIHWHHMYFLLKITKEQDFPTCFHLKLFKASHRLTTEDLAVVAVLLVSGNLTLQWQVEYQDKVVQMLDQILFPSITDRSDQDDKSDHES